jgi:hypothetical protein
MIKVSTVFLALFRYCDNQNSEIKNLKIEKAIIEKTGGTNTATTTGACILVGTMSGNIKNCDITGRVKSNGATAGIVVMLYGNIFDCKLNIEIEPNPAFAGGRAIFYNGTATKAKSILRCITLGNMRGISVALMGIGYSIYADNIKDCVSAIASYTTTHQGVGRIGAEGNIINCWGYDGALANGNIMQGGTTSSLNGADATIEQLHSKAFYRDILGWDMENTWDINDGINFPFLRGFN